MKRTALVVWSALATMLMPEPAQAQEPEPSAVAPPPMPLPRPPPPRARSLFSGAIDVGYVRASVYDVRLDMMEIESGAGFVVQRPHRVGFELRNLFTVWVGKTEAGRRLLGVTLRPVAFARWEWFAVGGYFRVGWLEVSRSTNSGSESAMLMGVGFLLEIQPFEIPHFPLFVQGHLDFLDWGAASVSGFGVNVGMRFCGSGCGF